MLESSWVAAQLAASQEGLNSMSEWVKTDYILNIPNQKDLSPFYFRDQYLNKVLHAIIFSPSIVCKP
jgi:hypothetical protein